MTYQIKGGKWVILYCDCSVDLFIVILLLYTGDMCRVGVYCWNYYCYYCIYLGGG